MKLEQYRVNMLVPQVTHVLFDIIETMGFNSADIVDRISPLLSLSGIEEETLTLSETKVYANSNEEMLSLIRSGTIQMYSEFNNRQFPYTDSITVLTQNGVEGKIDDFCRDLRTKESIKGIQIFRYIPNDTPEILFSR